MTKPPRPLFKVSTTDHGEAFAGRRVFLPYEFADLMQLQIDLAAREINLGVSDQEGDFGTTLMQLSALIGETLALHQNLYAREAFLCTAETGRALVLHARRLAYRPDQGLAATGHAVLTVAPGLKGMLPAGFTLCSAPRGGEKAQTYETTENLAVDAARNEALPSFQQRPATLVFDSKGVGSFRLSGTGLPLKARTQGLLVQTSNKDPLLAPVLIEALAEDPLRQETEVTVSLFHPPQHATLRDQKLELADAAGTPLFRFLANPAVQARRFGWNADPGRFPPAQLTSKGEFQVAAKGEAYGYQESPTNHGIHHVYLDTALEVDLRDQLVTVTSVDNLPNGYPGVYALRVVDQGMATVAFRSRQPFTYTTVRSGPGNQPITSSETTLVDSQIAATVSYIQLKLNVKLNGTDDVKRAWISLQAPILADWQFEASVVGLEPNHQAAGSPLRLEADFGEFRPGGEVVFETLDGRRSQVMRVTSLSRVAVGQTDLSWQPLEGASSTNWDLGHLRVFGNVARISHGESTEEILGSSDGVTPFLSLPLRLSPLTQLPGAKGGEPALEVWVNDVRWSQVVDFFDSGPMDRHYRLDFDENQSVCVIFGNGRQGAIPPSGRKHIRARYRHELGVRGNADPRQVCRIRKAHPLVARAVNATPLVGGADPAGLADLQRQATRPIRCFDRAVSVADHADLALLFPGVARAAARPLATAGVQVVVATAEGDAPPLAAVRAFLEARRDNASPLQVVGPQDVYVFVNLVVRRDPAVLRASVEQAIQEALLSEDPAAPGLFTFRGRGLGQAAHLSELVGRVEEARGVSSVEVRRFSLVSKDKDVVRDVITVGARQWLHLAPENLNIVVEEGPAA